MNKQLEQALKTFEDHAAYQPILQNAVDTNNQLNSDLWTARELAANSLDIGQFVVRYKDNMYLIKNDGKRIDIQRIEELK